MRIAPVFMMLVLYSFTADAQNDPPLNECMINKAYECFQEQNGLPDNLRNGQSIRDYCTNLSIRECE